jgi:hypothetical protein
MRLPRVRFTVRRMMVVVAIVGVLIGGWIAGERRREEFDRLARKYSHLSHIEIICTIDEAQKRLEVHEQKYFEQMTLKYRWAAKYPWLPVWPDSPEPE